MAVTYLHKKPSRLWHAVTNTKGLCRAFFQDDTKKDAKSFAREVGKGLAAAGASVIGITSVAVPILPFVLVIGGAVGGFYFTRNAKMKFKTVQKSNSFRNYKNRAEMRWLNIQKKGGVLKYALHQSKRLLNKIGTVIAPTVGVIGGGVGIVAGLTMANVIPVATTASVVTAILPAVALTTTTLGMGIAIGAVTLTAGGLIHKKCRQNLKTLNAKPAYTHATFTNEEANVSAPKTTPVNTLKNTQSVQKSFTQTAANDATPKVSAEDAEKAEKRRANLEKRDAARKARNKPY